jgi:hypothetical protein
MTDWTNLDGRARALLDAARVVLEGPAGNYDGGSGGSHGAPDSRAPAGNGAPTLQGVAQLLQNAGTGEELLRALHRAEVQLWRVRYSRAAPTRADTPERVRQRVVRDWIGSSPDEVADFEPVTLAQVCRWRADLGRDPLTGRAAEAPASTSWRTPDERAVRVQQLRAAHPHLSARAIGMMMNFSHPTILADLSRSPESHPG